MQQEQDRHRGDDQRLLDQLVPQVLDGTVDEVAAVVGCADPHVGRETLLDLRDSFLHTLDRLEGVRSESHHDDAGHNLPAAVQVRGAAPGRGAELHGGNVGDADGSTAGRDPDGHVLDVGNALEISQAADHVFPASHLEHAGADVDVVSADRPCHLGHGNAERP